MRRRRASCAESLSGPLARPLAHGYDAWERAHQVTDDAGTWTILYEAERGLPVTLQTPLGDTVSYTWDARGRRLGPTVQSGGVVRVTTTPTFNAAGVTATFETRLGPTQWQGGRWSNRGAATGDAPVATRWWSQTGAGTPLDSLSDWQRYDGDGRLVSWEQYHQAPVQDQDFSYDRGANLRIGGGGTVDPVTERLLAANGWSYAYDRAGNLVTATGPGGTWQYGWDALERLVSARFNGTLVARYAYDVEGRRVAKRVYTTPAGGTVGYWRFVYRGAHVASDLDSLGTVQARYVWGLGPDELVAVWQGGQHHYVALDGVGSVRTVARRDGTFVARWRYRAYGALIDSAGPGLALRYRWAGREWDAELGWYYVRARYYAPEVGRFVSEDPLGAAGGMNVYAYTDGRPLTARDPSGLVREYADRFSGQCLGFGGTACVSFDGSINQMGPSGWYAGAVGGAGFWAFFDKYEARLDYNDYLKKYLARREAAMQSGIPRFIEVYMHSKPLSEKDFIALRNEPKVWNTASPHLRDGTTFINDVYVYLRDVTGREIAHHVVTSVTQYSYTRSIDAIVLSTTATQDVLWSVLHEMLHHNGLTDEGAINDRVSQILDRKWTRYAEVSVPGSTRSYYPRYYPQNR